MDEWNNVCRSCLITAESFSYFIYENVSPETYFFCTSIEVKQDELPKSLCSCCYDLLKQLAEFKKTCIQSENKLLTYFNSLNLKEETGADAKTEVKVMNIGDIEVLVDSKDNKFDDDPSDADFYDNMNSQEQEEAVLKGEISEINQKGLKGAKPRSLKRPFNYTCELCSKQFVLNKRFEAHKLKHEGKIEPMQCKLCEKTFRSWSGLQRHNETDHLPHSFKDLTCTVCSKVCKTQFTLKVHYRTHEERKVQICDECGRQFKSALTLKNHLETHIKNRQRSFVCQHCGKKYLSKKTRAKHMYRRHTNRRFICHYCKYLFADKANLINHIKIHEGTQRLYKCDICFRALTSPASLVHHKRIHTGEKPFLCNFCPKRFTTKGVLVDHQRIHTGEKPFECVVCEQRFVQRGSLNRHMKVHDRHCN